MALPNISPLLPTSKQPKHAWVYLLVYRDPLVQPALLEGFLKYRPEVLDWQTYLPNTYLIKSPNVASSLAEVMKGFFRSEAWFILLDTRTDIAGWIPKAAPDVL